MNLIKSKSFSMSIIYKNYLLYGSILQQFTNISLLINFISDYKLLDCLSIKINKLKVGIYFDNTYPTTINIFFLFDSL